MSVSNTTPLTRRLIIASSSSQLQVEKRPTKQIHKRLVFSNDSAVDSSRDTQLECSASRRVGSPDLASSEIVFRRACHRFSHKIFVVTRRSNVNDSNRVFSMRSGRPENTKTRSIDIWMQCEISRYNRAVRGVIRSVIRRKLKRRKPWPFVVSLCHVVDRFFTRTC